MKKCLTLPAIRKLEAKGFRVANQPIVTGDIHGIPQVAGYELLPRFLTEDQTILTAHDFEQQMGIEDLTTLDALMVQEAIGASVSAESSDLFFSFNLRVSSLSEAGFAEFLTSRIAVMNNVERSRLVVEIDGSHLADGKSFSNYLPRLKKTLVELTSMGVRICVDGFNHRTNGFRLVSQLPVDAIKFCPEAVKAESRFLEGKCSDSESMDLEVMRSFGVSMRAWGCLVIADGIEARAQTSAAEGMGVTHYQGSAFGQALVEADLPDVLDAPANINRSYRGGDTEVKDFCQAMASG